MTEFDEVSGPGASTARNIVEMVAGTIRFDDGTAQPSSK
jgi:hypothetical protein